MNNKIFLFTGSTGSIGKSMPLKKNIYPVYENKLPPYITIRHTRGSDHLIFDRRKDDIRYNFRMKLEENYNLDDELKKFREKIKNKYGTQI